MPQQYGRGSNEFKYLTRTNWLSWLLRILWCCLGKKPTDPSAQYSSYQGADNEYIPLSWFEFHCETSWDGIVARFRPGIIC